VTVRKCEEKKMRSLLGTTLLCFLVALVADAAIANTYTGNPIKDNSLVQTADLAHQLSNGAGQGLFAGRTTQDSGATATISIRRGLVAFDLSSIPANATIQSAALTLSFDLAPTTSTSLVSLYRMTSDWGEGTSNAGGVGSGGGGGGGAPATQNDATWLYRFYNATSPASSPTWTNPGAEGDYITTASSSQGVSVGQNVIVPYTFGGAAMAADVQFWITHLGTNFGWIVKGDESAPGTARRFESRENINNGTNGTVDARPLLTVTFSVPEPGSLVMLPLALIGLLGRRRIHAML